MREARRVVTTDLGHRFHTGPWLFEHLDLELRGDEVYALVGPSGSGKSTLLSLLAGWTAPTAGTITRHDVSSVGWVFQNPHGVAARSALDHVSLPFLAQGMTRAVADRRAKDLLEEFDIAEVAGRPYAQLSGGEAQRLMLARGIAARPDLFLVDEPTAQLDPVSSALVSRTLWRLAGRGVIVVVATHDHQTRAACTQSIALAHREAGALP